MTDKIKKPANYEFRQKHQLREGINQAQVLNNYYLTESKCPICGGLFFLQDGANWAYRVALRNKTLTTCSWTCHRKAQEQLEGARKKKHRNI